MDPMLLTGLIFVAEKLLEKGVLEPLAEPLRELISEAFDKAKATKALDAARMEAWDEFKVQVGDAFERLSMLKTLTGLTKETGQLLAASAVEMTRPEAGKIPSDLLSALNLKEEDRTWLAKYLMCLRSSISKIAYFEPLIAAADDLDKKHRLDGIAKDVANMQADTKRIRSLLEQLAADRRLTDDDSSALEHYIEDMRSQLSTIKLPFIRKAPVNDSVTQLTQIFVPLYVRDEKAEEVARKKAARGSISQKEKQDEDAAKPINFNELLARYERFILIGSPGSGKSTLLRRAALAFAEGRAALDLGWQGEVLLPIFVRLRNFGFFLENNKDKFSAPCPGALVAHLEQMQKEGNRRSLPANFFDRRLDEGKCLVLLDGLDEVAGDRAEVAHFIQKFIHRYGKNGNRIGLTSRPGGYNRDVKIRLESEDLAIAEIMPLQRDGIKQLTQNLLLMDESGRKKYQNDTRLSERILGNPRLTEIAGIPLFCSALVQVYKYHSGVDLPERRVDILSEIINLLLGIWHSQSEVRDSQGLVIDDEFDDREEAIEYKGNRLAYLARVMQTDIKSDEISEEKAKSVLIAYLKDYEGESATIRRAKAILQNFHLRSGLLVEINPKTYSFLHKSFREYLAATALITWSEDPVQTLLGLLDEDPVWWDEVLSYMAAHPEGKSLHNKWLPVILKDAETHKVGSEPWERRLTVAAMMARDMTSRLPKPQRRAVQKVLYESATDTALPPQKRAAFADWLDRISLPSDLEKDLYTFVKIPGDEKTPPFWMGKYPVTNAQYARFLTPENFADKSLWMDFPQFASPEEGYREMKRTGDAGWVWLQKAMRDEDNLVDAGVLYPRYWRDSRFGEQRANAPVVGVSWWEANAYARWLQTHWDEVEEGQQGGLLGMAKPKLLRLPREDEWALAAGGAANGRFAFGTLENPKEEIVSYCNTRESGIGRTTPVWTYPQGASDPHGVMDMSGNIWEWQGNRYRDDKDWWAFRGGSWSGNSGYARVACRSSFFWISGYRGYRLGFRLVSPPDAHP